MELADRVEDLLARLTRAEMIGLLHQHQAAVPRLGIGPFRTGTEALHGVAWLGEATVFPQAVGLGATWDPELVERVGTAAGTEVRALHHKDPERVGLNVWAPVVNPLRDPRWGRNEEGYAEDPWLTGVLGTAFARGLRGDHPTYLRTAPTLKHFLGYNNETDRSRTSSDLPPRVLHEFELPAFRAPLQAGAAVAVMASYNLVNGRPAHLSPLLRRFLGAEVMIVGDAGAGTNIAGDQAFLPDHEAGFGAALRAGVDCFTEDDASPDRTVARLTAALERGLITESDVQDAARRILAVRFRLGEFDPDADPYAGITADVVNCAAHQDLAREAARRSVVLLRNDGGLLPLPATTRVAVIGPLAGTLFTDWYSGTLPYAVTLRDALPDAVHAEGVDRISLSGPGGPVGIGGGLLDVLDWGGGVLTLRAGGRYVRARDDGVLVADRPAPGEWVVRETFEVAYAGDEVRLRNVALDRWVVVNFDGTPRASAPTAAEATPFTASLVVDGLAVAAEAAARADVAVVVLGNHPMVNGRETEDRADLDLPPAQDALLRAVRAANPRTVLVVTSSYPYAIGWAAEHVPAILWSSHGGQESGAALAELLLGRTAHGVAVEPTGRLPQTWYRGAEDLPDLFDYDIISSEATYQYFRGRPLFPFGHGLGYTRFEHRDLRLSADTVEAGGSVEISVDVVNTWDRAGEEVVQLYTRQRRSRVRQPLRRLRDFQRVRLAPGARATVTFALAAADLAFHDAGRDAPVVETARHTVMVGRSCTDITATAVLAVRGSGPGNRTGPLSAATRDEEYGTRLTAATALSGDAVVARSPGAWLGFTGVDVGAGPRRVRVIAAAPAGGARLELRLGDPLTGPLAAALDVPFTGGVHDFEPVCGPWTGDGVHDLFLVMDTAGARVGEIAWEAA